MITWPARLVLKWEKDLKAVHLCQLKPKSARLGLKSQSHSSSPLKRTKKKIVKYLVL